MRASLSNKRRLNGYLGLLVILVAFSAAGCTEPETDRPGTWKPADINDRNLRAMLVNPRDAYSGNAALTSRGDTGARAVTRLLTDKRRPLLDASIVHVGATGTSQSDPAIAAPGPVGGTP